MPRLLTILLFQFFFLNISIAFGQTDSLTSPAMVASKWKRSLETGLNVNQASFSDNWKGGGVTSLALGSLLNARAFYQGDKVSFDTDLQMTYGFLKNKGQNFRK